MLSWRLRTLRAAHYLGAGPAFLARAFDFRCLSETFALWRAQLSGISQLVKPFDFRRLYRTFALGAHWSRSAANHACTGLSGALANLGEAPLTAIVSRGVSKMWHFLYHGDTKA